MDQKTKKLKLILPNKKYVASFLRAEKEFEKEGIVTAAGGAKGLMKSLKDFPVYFKKIKQNRIGRNLEGKRVPETMYWALVGNKVVGRLALRHHLNKELRFMGGHIGYAVIKSERRKGYATEMLRLGLLKAKKLGIKKALLTCDEINIGSRKVIETNGGKLENKVKEKGIKKLRFWAST